MSAIRGDFDGDRQLSLADLQILVVGLRESPPNHMFDLSQDGTLDFADLAYWVKNLKGTWIGDADLDGQFNSGDLVQVFQSGMYEDAVSSNSTWASGDWDVAGDFSTSDLVLAFQDGGYENATEQAVPAIPEPSGLFVLAITAMSLISPRKRMSGSRACFGLGRAVTSPSAIGETKSYGVAFGCRLNESIV